MVAFGVILFQTIQGESHNFENSPYKCSVNYHIIQKAVLNLYVLVCNMKRACCVIVITWGSIKNVTPCRQAKKGALKNCTVSNFCGTGDSKPQFTEGKV